MRGISPLVSSVLLIAFSVTVAVLIGSWYRNLTRTSTETVGTHARESLICSYGGINLYNVIFSSSSQNISGNIKNTGNVILGDIDIQIFYTNGSSLKHDLNLVLEPGDTESFNVSSGCSSLNAIDFVRVKTNCSNVDDEVENSEITLT